MNDVNKVFDDISSNLDKVKAQVESEFDTLQDRIVEAEQFVENARNFCQVLLFKKQQIDQQREFADQILEGHTSGRMNESSAINGLKVLSQTHKTPSFVKEASFSKAGRPAGKPNVKERKAHRNYGAGDPNIITTMRGRRHFYEYKGVNQSLSKWAEQCDMSVALMAHYLNESTLSEVIDRFKTR